MYTSSTTYCYAQALEPDEGAGREAERGGGADAAAGEVLRPPREPRPLLRVRDHAAPEGGARDAEQEDGGAHVQAEVPHEGYLENVTDDE